MPATIFSAVSVFTLSNRALQQTPVSSLRICMVKAEPNCHANGAGPVPGRSL